MDEYVLAIRLFGSVLIGSALLILYRSWREGGD